MLEHYFVIPFVAGFCYLLVILIAKGIKWINCLSNMDKLRLFQSLKTKRTYNSIVEIFLEGLIHRSIFRKNPVLGYMHMSLAFGWFLLIVFGHIETMIAQHSFVVPFYLPIFSRYFENETSYFLSGFFSFMMDFLLLLVLSGVTLAMIKRFKKSLFGIKKTTHLKTGDRIALSALWLIFPLRLIAESVSAALYNNGGFLTSGLGSIFVHFHHLELIHMPIWFAYSISLGFFFVALPYSRYMHIPTEILFILVRNTGIQLKKRVTSYSDIQIYSCSRCGLCLDNCQLSIAGIKDTQSVYLLKNIRNHHYDDEQLFNCLLCGRCKIDCPVNIDTVNLRITQRIESTKQYNSSYDYLKQTRSPKTDVVYFAGCMTHLSPGIITSMKTIFKTAHENFWFMDEEKAPCCGRPLMLAGQYEAASKLIKNNTQTIINSGAHTLVVSCPICYKIFKEDYHLGTIEILFHVEYIQRLIQKKRLHIVRSDQKFVYHDPCELGRGCGMYDQPRQLLKLTGTVLPIENEKENSYCCGGSLGNLKIDQHGRDLIRNQAIQEYASYSPDVLVTACPLCKKTFSRNQQLTVMDIAEVVVINQNRYFDKEHHKDKQFTVQKEHSASKIMV